MEFFLISVFFLFHYSQLMMICSSSTVLSSTNRTTSHTPQCRSDESSALFRFKHSFSIDTSPFACDYYRNDWDESTNCCEWSGVTCERVTGHVIGLDLSCNGLRGVISSNSSLFFLHYLQILDLSFNDFTGSNVSQKFGHFKAMTHLDLSFSNFETLGFTTFKSLAQNSSEMRELSLAGIDLSLFSSSLLLNNFSSSLTRLNLDLCNLHGELPEKIFRLPNLQELNLLGNTELSGSFPKSNWTSPLRALDLSLTQFSVDLPYLTKNARLLSSLFLIQSRFVGSYPLLDSNLSQLVTLDISNNDFSGHIPWSSLNLKRLRVLDLSFNNFVGELPKVYGNSTHNFSSFEKSSKLKVLDLSSNFLNGTIPAWIYSLPDLGMLDLSNNSFTGEFGDVELSKLTELKFLGLSSNNLSFKFNQSINHSFDNLFVLKLSSCNISEFPNFIKSSKSLFMLDLSENQLHGSVPKWLWETGKNSLTILILSHNFLTHIESLPWKKLGILDLHSNFILGNIPILSPLLWVFSVSRNQFSGEIPNSICDLTSLDVLDFSFNNLSGKIPQCMGSFSEKLSVLDLRSNKLKGTIPATFSRRNKLRTLNLNGNQLEGDVPRSLESCKNLEVFDLGNNLFEGTFPYWLETLPELRVLVLRSNKFRGSLENPRTKFPFQKLRIMDLSTNEFSGSLPRKLFENFEAMMNTEKGKMGYMGESNYQDSVMVTIKGFYIELVKIQTIFTTIDFSSNNFTGEIPASIGRLKALKGLNLSHNKLTGAIPSSLRNLTNLEWLDLSSNVLVGEIPVDLADIISLAFLNLSRNRLEGPIPHGNQFNTFGNDSFVENLALCGFPLTEKCNEDTNNAGEKQVGECSDDAIISWFDWKIVAMGYVSGLVIGISLGYVLFYSDGILSCLCDEMISRMVRSR